MKFTKVGPKPSAHRPKKRDFSTAEYADQGDDSEVTSHQKDKKTPSGPLGGRGGSAQFDGAPRRKNSFESGGEEMKRRRYESDAPSDDDSLPPQKSSSREVFVVDQSRAPVVVPEVVAVLHSKFGSKAEVILNQIESDDTDGATTLIYRSLLMALVDMLPVMESAVRNSKGARGVYQFNQTVSQIRELLNDIQSVRDRGLLGNSIVERHIRPSFMNIGVQIIQGLTIISEAARERMSKEDYRDFRDSVVHGVKVSLADYIKRQHDEVTSAVVQSLS